MVGRMIRVGLALVLGATLVAVVPAGAAKAVTVRFATLNPSVNRGAAGELVSDLAAPFDPAFPDATVRARRQQAANVAEIIQRVRPEVLLINEFDFDPAAVPLLQANYLGVGQNGA